MAVHSIFFVLLTLPAIFNAVGRGQSEATTDNPVLGTFAYPPASSRPKFRYWFPDASIPASAVQSDIAALSNVSAGGLEFLGYYNQGFPPVSTDWSLYGFGTPAFKELLRAALKTTAEHGLVFDFAIGPNTGAGVPAIPRTEGLAMELVYGTKLLNNSQKAGSLPPPVLEFNHSPLNGWVHEPENWGPSDLVAVVAAQIKSRSGSNQIVLDQASVQDITNLTQNGALDWAPPAGGQAGSSWVVLAFYQRYSNDRVCVSTPRASSWIGNGSWNLDHFSAAGAKKATDFWDQHLFDDKEIDGLMRQVGMYSWEDSMEMMATLWWTPDFLNMFSRARGYNAAKYLPVFFQAKNLWNSYGAPYSTTYMLDGLPSDGGKYAEDYRLTLNDGYSEYLRELQRWAAARGMAHSAQPAYNMPLDMSATIPLLGAPELESLGFSENIDNYRQFTGPAHLFGRNAISTEIGARRGGAYIQTVLSLLTLFRDSFAAGVNTLVIHGFAYGGPYDGTTWPGYTPFQYEFCEMWGPRQPAWQHLNDSLLYSARISEVLKTGVPRADIAFYSWKQPFSVRPVFQGADLTAAGYTWEYLGPDNLALTNASVQNNILAPDGPAYKGIILYGQTKITPAASAALVKFAEAGLPVVIVGSAPNLTVGSVGQDIVSKNMARLTSGGISSVRTVRNITPDLLAQAGILPRLSAQVSSGAANTSQLFTVWRSKIESRLELVYLLNRGADSTFEVSFVVPEDAVPYVLDAWTGTQTRLGEYLRTRDGISMRIDLAQQQSTIVAFVMPADGSVDLPIYVVSHSPNIARVRVTTDGRLEGLLNDARDANALLSNNVQVTIPPIPGGDSPATLPTMRLGPWNLTVESYAAPATLSTSTVAVNKTKIVVQSPVDTLAPWTKIKGLERVSGLGTYRATFSLPQLSKNGTDASYIISFTGRVLNTLRVRVNDALVPAIDVSAPGEGRDITALLKIDGVNTVEIEVSSTLFNAVKARVSSLKSVGSGVKYPKYYTDVDWAEFGLIGDVVIQTWRRVLLS